MSRLFPSEVARLVLGYLKERGCYKAHDEFLRESPDLNEFRSCLIGPNTYDYPTSVNGRSLVQHLNNNNSSSGSCLVPNQPQPLFASQPAPVMAQTLPIITATMPFIATPVPVPAPVTPAVAAVSQREIELLRKLQANQATISSLNSKMNQMTGKTKGSSEKRSSAKQQQSQPQTSQNRVTVQSNQKQQKSATTASNPQPVMQTGVLAVTVSESQPPADPFKTPVKQIVRRTRHGYVTPNGATGSSPKKATPRKSLTPRKLTPVKSSDVSTGSCSSDRDSTLTPSKINLNNIHIEPEKVVEKFINNPGMPDILAEKINEIWKNYNNGSGIQTLVSGDICVLDSVIRTPVKSAQKSTTKSSDDQTAEKAPVDRMVSTVMKELEQHSSISQFIDDFAANECMGFSAFSDLDCLLPFGSESSPFSSYDSTPVHSVGDEDQNPGSLTTPKSDFREQAIACHSAAAASSAVKNLMQDLKTPEKKVPSPFNSSPFAVRGTGTRESDSPVCIVIPDDNCGSRQQSASQQSASGDRSPAKKFRRIAPATDKPASPSHGKHVPVTDMQTIRISGCPVRRSSVPISDLRQVQKSMQFVRGKSVRR